MMNKKIIVLAVLGAGAWWLYRQSQQSQAGENYIYSVTDTVANAIQDFAGATVGYIDDTLTGGFLKVSRMKTVTAADVVNKNVQAFLRMIRHAEGTDDANGYRKLFGGWLFTGYADHPRILVKKSGYRSTAAGAYQFKADTWDETKREMGLTDFTPANQDKGAVGRIAARGALDDVKAGRFNDAVKKCSKEWASLPFSTDGQPTITIATAQGVYAANGGSFA